MASGKYQYAGGVSGTFAGEQSKIGKNMLVHEFITVSRVESERIRYDEEHGLEIANAKRTPSCESKGQSYFK